MKNMKIIISVFIVFIFLLNLSIIRVNCQISTPCTISTITTFTPCLNFITGSSSSGSSSPTKNCCKSIKSFVSNNKDCACLIVTGNVPISIPFISQNLAISLPRMCNGGVPIQCKAKGAPLPPPGPALFAPPPAAIAPSVEGPSDSASPAKEPKPTRASKASTVAPGSPPNENISPATEPSSELLPPSSHPRIKPVLMNPKSASSSPSHYMFSPSILAIVALIVLKC